MNNLKKLILIFVYVLLSTCVMPDLVFAKVMDSRDIKIRAKTETNIPRSILPVRAYVDGQTVYVSFYELPEEATVTVVASQSGLAIKKVYQSPQAISISVEEVGEFQIEISYGPKAFIGDFVLE